MGTSYVKNHLGFTLSDAAMEDIPHPYAELVTHVTLKDMQAFGLIGTTVLGPITAVARAHTRNLGGIMAQSTKFGRGGLLLGAVVGPLMVYGKVKNDPVVKVTDRCYRLRHNRGQVRVDRASIVGGAGGAAAAMAMGANPMFGLLAGMSAGILGQAVYNAKTK